MRILSMADGDPRVQFIAHIPHQNTFFLYVVMTGTVDVVVKAHVYVAEGQAWSCSLSLFLQQQIRT